MTIPAQRRPRGLIWAIFAGIWTRSSLRLLGRFALWRDAQERRSLRRASLIALPSGKLLHHDPVALVDIGCSLVVTSRD
jgi:hypothetical protein